MKHYYVYILTNRTNRVLYTGVTNNLLRRGYEHKGGLIEGFTKKYKLNKLVYFEVFTNVNDAIAAEKKIKGWLRSKKINLIESINPNWKDLFFSLEEHSFTTGVTRDPSLRSGRHPHCFQFLLNHDKIRTCITGLLMMKKDLKIDKYSY